MAVVVRGGRGSGLLAGGGGASHGLRSFFSYRIFIYAMFSLHFLAALSFLFASDLYASTSDPVKEDGDIQYLPRFGSQLR